MIIKGVIIMDRRETVQRTIILETIKSIYHPTVNDIYEQVKKNYPQIGKATVYRNVNLLVEDGLLRKICIGEKEAVYDWDLDSHYHLRCSECKNIYDIDLDYSKELDEKIESLGFMVSHHELVFTGVCPKCQEKNKKMEE